jgi:hypothetical protein
MKSLILLIGFAMNVFASNASAPTVNEKVLKIFHQTFKDPENVVWSYSKHVYSVWFTADNIHTSVKYDEDGNFISSLRYYLKDQLPVDIHTKIQKKYPDKTIFIVTEQTIGDDVYYYVKLEDATTWTTVKVDNYRNMQETEFYPKAD